MILRNQQGFTPLETVLSIVVVGAIVVAGYFAYQNYQTHQPAKVAATSPTPTATPSSSLSEAVAALRVAASKQTDCGSSAVFSPDITIGNMKVVGADQTWTNLPIISSDYKFAMIEYGCSSQGSTALFKYNSNGWQLIASDASTMMMCSKVDHQGIPKSISSECYLSNTSAETRAILQ